MVKRGPIYSAPIILNKSWNSQNWTNYHSISVLYLCTYKHNSSYNMHTVNFFYLTYFWKQSRYWCLSVGTTLDYVHCVRKMCFHKMFFWLIDGICWFYAAIHSSKDSPTINQLMDKNKSSGIIPNCNFLKLFSNRWILAKMASKYVRWSTDEFNVIGFLWMIKYLFKN